MIGAGIKRFAMRMYIALSLALAIGGAALAQTPSPNEKKTISITWLGQRCASEVHEALRDGKVLA